MKPKLRFYERGDYALLCEWCRARGVFAPPQGALPKLGAVALGEDGRPAGMAWLYMDNSVGVAMLAWTTTSPEISPFAAAESVDALCGFLCAHAAHAGYRWVMATAAGALAQRLGRNGFFVNHDNVQQLFKRN